ncbi:hypothetical protein [Vibrio sp. D431a]|uniref:hypothetical protein n=1 Tax=Vibrio sp. D431a TaxID=2837388 RepID=UPI0025547882|nr:hypothetical protein [Vibrio sp. D431a]MDK9789962.1 hypothetical protein [Vibrio sp. D431a]
MLKKSILCSVIASMFLTGCGGSGESGRYNEGSRPDYETPIKKVKMPEGVTFYPMVIESQDDVIMSQSFTLGSDYYGDVVHTYENVKMVNTLNGKRWSANSLSTLGQAGQQYVKRLAALVSEDSLTNLMLNFNEKATIIGKPYNKNISTNRFLKTMIAKDLLNFYNGAETMIEYDPDKDKKADSEEGENNELELNLAPFVKAFNELLESGLSPAKAAMSASERVIDSILRDELREQKIAGYETQVIDYWLFNDNAVNEACGSLRGINSKRLYSGCFDSNDLAVDFLKLQQTRKNTYATFIEFHTMANGECSTCSVVRNDRILLPKDLYERDYFNRVVISKGIVEMYLKSLPWDGYSEDDNRNNIPWIIEGTISNFAWENNIDFQALSELTNEELESVFNGTFGYDERARTIYSTIVAYLTGDVVRYYETTGETKAALAEKRHLKYVGFINKLKMYDPMIHKDMKSFMDDQFNQMNFRTHKDEFKSLGKSLTINSFKEQIRDLARKIVDEEKEYLTFTQESFPEQ